MAIAGLFISVNLFAQQKQEETYLQVLQQQEASIQAELANPSPNLSASDLVYLQDLLVKTQGLIAQIYKPEQAQIQQEIEAKNQIPQNNPQNTYRIIAGFDPNNPSAIPAYVSTGNATQDEQIVTEWLLTNGLIKP